MRGSVPRTSVIAGPKDPDHRDARRVLEAFVSTADADWLAAWFRATATHNKIGT
jgi:hypothetical protein